LLNVAADEEFLLGAGGGDVEQAAVFGVGAVVFEAGGELPGGGVEFVVAQVEEQPIGEENFRACAAMFVGSVGDDGEGAFEPFGFVDGHQLDGACGGGVGRKLAFAQADIPQGLDVGEEVGQADEARAVRVGEEFFDVANHALAARMGGKDGAIVGQVEQAFEDGGGGGAGGEGVEGGEDLIRMNDEG